MKERLEIYRGEVVKAKEDSEAISHEFYDVHEERIRTKFEEEREKV